MNVFEGKIKAGLLSLLVARTDFAFNRMDGRRPRTIPVQ